MRYNKRNFKRFLKQHSSVADIDFFFEEFCKDLECRYGNTGLKCYELHACETRDRQVHCFYY